MGMKREVRVDVPGVLEQFVETALHLLPDRVPGGLDHHATAHVAVVGQSGLFHDVEVPLRVIGGAFGDGVGHELGTPE